jgi:hypothetical protein
MSVTFPYLATTIWPLLIYGLVLAVAFTLQWSIHVHKPVRRYRRNPDGDSKGKLDPHPRLAASLRRILLFLERKRSISLRFGPPTFISALKIAARNIQTDTNAWTIHHGLGYFAAKVGRQYEQGETLGYHQKFVRKDFAHNMMHKLETVDIFDRWTGANSIYPVTCGLKAPLTRRN